MAKGCSVGSIRQAPSGKGSSEIISATSSRWRVRRELAGEGVIGLAGAVVGGLAHQRDQALAQLGQHRPHPLGGHLRLVLVEQRVVGMGEAGESLVAVGVALGELDVLARGGAAASRSRSAAWPRPRRSPRRSWRGPSRRGAPRGPAGAFSQSRATTRTRSASIDSPGGTSPCSERTRSISPPISSSMNISWRTRARVARVWARASAPAGGIIVRSSQASSEAARLRSWIWPRRSRSSSTAAIP